MEWAFYWFICPNSMDQAASEHRAAIASPDVTEPLVLVGIGDLGADGKADMVFRRTDGMLSAFLMNGFQVQSAQRVGSVGMEWVTCYGQGLGGITSLSLQ